jgi:hypothetical protein
MLRAVMSAPLAVFDSLTMEQKRSTLCTKTYEGAPVLVLTLAPPHMTSGRSATIERLVFLTLDRFPPQLSRIPFITLVHRLDLSLIPWLAEVLFSTCAHRWVGGVWRMTSAPFEPTYSNTISEVDFPSMGLAVT